MRKFLLPALGLLAAIAITGCSTTGKMKCRSNVVPLFDGKTLNGWIDQENSAYLFAGGDIQDVGGFAKKLADKSDPVSAFLSDKLGAVNMVVLADYIASPSNSVVAPIEQPPANSTAKKTKAPPSKASVVRSMLAKNLKKIISSGAVYDETRFSGVQLRPETKELLGKNPQGYDLERLNKLLIEDAYPAELVRGAERFTQRAITAITGCCSRCGTFRANRNIRRRFCFFARARRRAKRRSTRSQPFNL
jgi:hypothetical protein